MKKAILILVAMLFVFSSCVQADNDTQKELTIVMPDGAPSVVFAKMMYDNKDIDGYKVNYEIVAGVQGIQAKINDFDLAVMPTNLAANLYNKGEALQLISVNVHGVLYMVGKNEITSLDDLKGKVVYCIGQGGTPDFTFQYILDNAKIEYEVTDGESVEGKVAMKYETDGSVVLGGLLSGDIEYAIIGEPLVTQAIAKSKGTLKTILSIQDEWKTATNQESDYSYPQAGIVAKQQFAQDNPETITAILSELNGLSDWLENNTDKAVEALSDNNSTITTLTADSITRCNIYTITAKDAYTTVNAYYDILFAKQSALIGGKIPDDAFYYNYIQ